MKPADKGNKYLEVLSLIKQESSRLKPTKRRTYNYWTLNEDEKLMRLARELNYDWIKVSLEFIERTSEEVEKRWKLRVDPSTKKTPWTKEEDRKILNLHRKLGGNWKLIATHLTGRLPSAIKNRYYSKLQNLEQGKECLIDDDLSTMADVTDTGPLSIKPNFGDQLKIASKD